MIALNIADAGKVVARNSITTARMQFSCAMYNLSITCKKRGLYKLRTPSFIVQWETSIFLTLEQ